MIAALLAFIVAATGAVTIFAVTAAAGLLLHADMTGTLGGAVCFALAWAWWVLFRVLDPPRRPNKY